MFRERNVRRRDTQDERRINLQMRMLRSEVHFVDGDEEVFLLLGIDELDGTLLHQVLKGHLVVADVLDILLGNLGSAIPDHDQGTTSPSTVGVDDDVVIEIFIGDVDL